jgi:hypothetical protein
MAARVSPAARVGEIGDDAGQQAAPERGVGDKGNAEIARRLARFRRLLPIQQRELALHRRDRVHRVARRMRSGRASHNPINRTLPRSTSRLISPTVSSTGTSDRPRCW